MNLHLCQWIYTCILFITNMQHTVQFLMCLLVSRIAESSPKETQKDVHCQNGRDEKPVEEYRCALCQLVSICLEHQHCEKCSDIIMQRC